jgi:valyl-tRNA synthetase
MSRCHQVVAKVTNSLEQYHFAEAAVTIQDFIRNEFADWYIEINKTRNGADEFDQSQKVLQFVWDRSLHLLHPFMPFLTETLWLQNRQSCESLMISPWPEGCPDGVDDVATSGFETMQALVRAIRAVRTEYKVESNATIRAVVNFSEKGLADKQLSFSDFEREKNAIALLSRVRVASLCVDVLMC